MNLEIRYTLCATLHCVALVEVWLNLEVIQEKINIFSTKPLFEDGKFLANETGNPRFFKRGAQSGLNYFTSTLPGPSNPLLRHPTYQPRQISSFFAPLTRRQDGIRGSGKKHPSLPVVLRKDEPEAQVVVRVTRTVPVTVCRTNVPRVVVPAAAAIHTVRALFRIPPHTVVIYFFEKRKNRHFW